MEAEGGGAGNYSEPLTEHQIQGFLAIARAWEWEKKRKLVVGETVWAHWQLAKKFGYAATACESGRYAEAWKRLEGDMADPRVDEILRLLGKTEMDEWLAKGNEPVLKTIAKEQKARGEITNAINAHLANHPGTVEVGLMYTDFTNALSQAAKAIEAAGRARR
jgi:predicted Zn-dependent protease